MMLEGGRSEATAKFVAQFRQMPGTLRPTVYSLAVLTVFYLFIVITVSYCHQISLLKTNKQTNKKANNLGVVAQ